MTTATQRERSHGPGRQGPENISVNGTADDLSALLFTITSAPVAQPKRGGGLKAAKPVPPAFRDAFNELLKVNGTEDNAKVGPMVLTNGQITSLLGANPSSALSKMIKVSERSAYIMPTVTTVANEEYPGKRSADADDSAVKVRIEWSVRYRTEEEQTAHNAKVAARKAKADAKAAK